MKFRSHILFLLIALALAALFALPLRAIEPGPAPSRDPFSPNGGSLLLCGPGDIPAEAIERFIAWAGGESAKLVLILPDRAPEASLIASHDPDWWMQQGIGHVRTLRLGGAEASDLPAISEALSESSALWMAQGTIASLAQSAMSDLLSGALKGVLERGGAIGLAPGVARRLAHADALQFDLMPGFILDDLSSSNAQPQSLFESLQRNPGLAGLAIEADTAALVRGRRLGVLGSGSVVVCLAASQDRPIRIDHLKAGAIADLVATSRAAIARAQPSYPPDKYPPPLVPSGTLVIVGGGRLSDEILRLFIEAAGGPEAPIVVIPTAGGDRPSMNPRIIARFRSLGAGNVRVLHATRRADVESSEFMTPLRAARGVWFTGGRQWRLVDAYLETEAYALFHDVLARGGVIGGSSAGATIQGDYLVRGNPLGNTDMMAEGYERGMAFLPGVAVDQHFAQRNRFADLARVVERFPQLICLGIDVSTAAIVRGGRMDVMGAGAIAVYDHRKGQNSPAYLSVPSGEHYDLHPAIAEPASP